MPDQGAELPETPLDVNVITGASGLTVSGTVVSKTSRH